MTQKQLIEQACKYIGEYFEDGEFMADFLRLTPSERVKFSIEIMKSIKADESGQAVTLTVKYPDGSPFNNSTSTAA